MSTYEEDQASEQLSMAEIQRALNAFFGIGDVGNVEWDDPYFMGSYFGMPTPDQLVDEYNTNQANMPDPYTINALFPQGYAAPGQPVSNVYGDDATFGPDSYYDQWTYNPDDDVWGWGDGNTVTPEQTTGGWVLSDQGSWIWIDANGVSSVPGQTYTPPKYKTSATSSGLPTNAKSVLNPITGEEVNITYGQDNDWFNWGDLLQEGGQGVAGFDVAYTETPAWDAPTQDVVLPDGTVVTRTTGEVGDLGVPWLPGEAPDQYLSSYDANGEETSTLNPEYGAWNALFGEGTQHDDFLYGGRDFGYGHTLEYDPETAAQSYNNWLAREKKYGDFYNDIMGVFRGKVGDEYRGTSANMKADLARRGLLTGSEDYRAQNMLQGRYDDETLRTTSMASNEQDQLRSSDMGVYSDLSNTINANSDMATVLGMADTQVAGNISNASEKANEVNFTGVFQDLADLYNLDQYRRGASTAFEDSYNKPFTTSSTPKAYAGTGG